jgi:lipoprotein-anchoring transpeptidase ErfK/SrfK
LGAAASASALSLAGCVTNDGGMSLAEAEKHYGAVADKKFPISAADISQVDPKFFRRTVNYESDEAPGTIIVDNANYFVYRIEGEGKATRYGANVGRQGFLWHGEAYIGRKAECTLYLYQNNRYTLYTIYSTSEPDTIGTNLTSGCTGLLTQDMIDLYDRTAIKTKVIVMKA